MTLTLDNVASVYSGKRGRCACGCSGKHTYSTEHKVWASKDRGYDVGDDEINDRTVKMMKYQGSILDGFMHGEGRLTYENGEYYDGEWVRGNNFDYISTIRKEERRPKWIKITE